MLLEVANADRRPGGLWVLTEQLPAELGARPRFVVERLASGADRAAALPAARRPPRPATPSARCGCGWSTRSGWC